MAALQQLTGNPNIPNPGPQEARLLSVLLDFGDLQAVSWRTGNSPLREEVEIELCTW